MDVPPLGLFPVKVHGERQHEDPGQVTQGQVEQEDVTGTAGSPEAGIVEQCCYITHNPHGQGEGEQYQEDVAVPPAVLKLVAKLCGLVEVLQDRHCGL